MLRRTQCKPTILQFVSDILDIHLSQTLPVYPMETLAFDPSSVHNAFAGIRQNAP